MIRTAIFGLMAGTVMAGAAFAQSAPALEQGVERPNPILRLDQNDDGQISREEMQAMGQNPMARADANGDGTVSRDEVISAAVDRATERAGAMFDRFDEDNDGEIAVENLPEPPRHHADRVERLFEKFDANGDGTLSTEEIRPMGRRGHGDPDRG